MNTILNAIPQALGSQSEHRRPGAAKPGTFRKRALCMAVTVAMGAAFQATPAGAATATWNGGASNGYWSTYLEPIYVLGIVIGYQNSATNWGGVGLAGLPANGNDLVFAGTTHLVNTNDWLSSIHDLTFAAGAGAFTLNGSGLTLTGNITNASGTLQTLNLPITLGASGKTWDGGSAGMAINAAVIQGDNSLTLKNKTAVTSATDVIVGNAASATLSLNTASTLNNVNAYLGNTNGSLGTALVEGAGTQWASSGTLYVGNAGNGALTIQNSGEVSASTARIGTNNPDISGSADVLGSGAELTVGSTLYVGDNGVGTLNILNGAKVTDTTGIVGFSFPGSGTVTVDGAGSLWANSGLLQVGRSGDGHLNVRNQGKVTSASGQIGTSQTGKSGTLTVTDAGSQWINTGVLSVGASGRGTLNVQNGGFVSNTGATIGDGLGSTGFVTVTGPGSEWSSAGSLTVGLGASGTLNILDGGQVTSTSASVGYGVAGSGTVTVSGAGSQWINSGGSLFVGQYGVGSLSIVNGGVVKNTSATLGNYACSSSGNGSVLVRDAGSLWDNTGNLSIGTCGSGSLRIENGGEVNSANSSVGYTAYTYYTSASGTVTVTGAGSRWINSGALSLGSGDDLDDSAGQGSLSILNGGYVRSTTGALGVGGGYKGAGSTGTVTVDGVGSRWIMTDVLKVGVLGTGTLNVQQGGQVSNMDGQIGVAMNSSGTVTVTDTGSQWNNAGNLSVGMVGTGTLNILNGGQVSVGGLLNMGSKGVLNLDGGTLRLSTNPNVVSGGQLNWLSGTLNYTGDASLGNGWLGLEATPVMLVTAGKNLQIDQTFTIGSGKMLFLGGGSFRAGTVNLAGGSVWAPGGYNVSDVGNIGGFGTVTAAISGGTGKNITASGGNLALGDINSFGAFNYAGGLETGANQIVLLSKDKAQLGSSTHLGDAGSLVTANGAELGNGEALTYTGNASVQGNFTNNGAVSGSNGALTFLGDVNGAGSFAGNIVFHAAYNPGNSPATVSFNGGNATYDATSVLTMEILGAAPGSQYDQLVDIDLLTFNGTLKLVFADGYMPGAGTSFDLFDFQSFYGTLAPDHIQVVGLDARQLDFSQLTTTGTLAVAAVPEPETYALMLVGLGLIGLAVRRRITS